MVNAPPIARIAALIGDPARALMLSALMDGRSRTAGELARTAGISPQTASGHLAKLVDAGLLIHQQQGRHRYHGLASSQVAHALESLMVIAKPHRSVSMGPADAWLRQARTCYDHIAGELAVRLAEGFVSNGWIRHTRDGWALTERGHTHVHATELGKFLANTRRPMVKACLDWSERKPHIGGQLGSAILRMALDRGWVRRTHGSRALRVHDGGRDALQSLAEALGGSAKDRS
jgi:DNA-binding transcriptional ArsR family regulator